MSLGSILMERLKKMSMVARLSVNSVRNSQQTILKHLEKISFDSEFHNKKVKNSSKSEKKHSIRENATLNVHSSDSEPEV